MDFIKYNSKSEIFKKPFGAVKENEIIHFNIHLKKGEQEPLVSLIIREDGKSDSLFISMQKSDEYDNYDIFSADFSPAKTGLYFYRFEVHFTEKTLFIGLKDRKTEIGEWLKEWQLTVYSKDFITPEWIKGAIMYQIFPDRFARDESIPIPETANERKIHKDWNEIPEFIYENKNYKANDFFLGNISGVSSKLQYLKDLGVDIIYFNPIFESSENHRYSTADYLNTDPYFGTNKEFKAFLKQAESIGIRIILDGVFSHTGADSIYFNKFGNYSSSGAFNSKSSPYFDWYSFYDYPNKYECWWNFDNLPNTNESTPSFLEFITGKNGVINFWQNMGVYGWRLDVADELPDIFLESLYKASKENNKDAFIIGEVWEDATNKFAYGVRRKYLLGNQMDSVMNYPWRTAILDFVKHREGNLFFERIMEIAENYPKPALNSLMNIISTHDTERALTNLGISKEIKGNEQGSYIMTEEEYNNGKNRIFQAVFLQFTLPGIPSIYYGDEVGLYGFKDPYSRKTFPYGKEDFEILQFYKKISSVRKTYREDFSYDFKPYIFENGFVSFIRGNLICGINKNNEKYFIPIEKYKIVFSWGEYEEKDGIFLNPESFIIIEAQ